MRISRGYFFNLFSALIDFFFYHFLNFKFYLVSIRVRNLRTHAQSKLHIIFKAVLLLVTVTLEIRILCIRPTAGQI